MILMKFEVIEIPNPMPYKYEGMFSNFNEEPFARLTKDATFIIQRTDTGREFYVIIPKGFVTDFGTVPKWAQWIINPRGKGERAYVLHDWLCITGICSPYTADNILYSAMKYCDVPSYQRVLVRSALYAYHAICDILPSKPDIGLNYQDVEYKKLPPYTPIPDLV